MPGVDHSAVIVQQAARPGSGRRAGASSSVSVRPRTAAKAFTEPFDKVLVVNNLGMWHEPDEGLKALSSAHAARRTDRDRLPAAVPRHGGDDGNAAASCGHLTQPAENLRSDTLALTPPLSACAGGPVKTAVPVPSTPRWLESEFPAGHHASRPQRSDAPQVANRGMARPPLVYGAAMVTGVFLEFGWPLPFPRLLAALLGSVLVVVAVVVPAYAIRQFQTAAPVPGNKPTTVLVRTGPYRCSRNPIYVAFSLFQLGIASWVNSGVADRHLIAAVALMAAVVIPREERYLERRFGADYVDYKRSVRRWL